MIWSVWALLLGCTPVVRAQSPAPASLAATLQAARWQRRVLLVYAPTPADADLRRQRQLLETARPALQARDVVVQEVIASQLSAPDRRYLHDRLGVPAAGFAVLLLGKDGGVKRRETAPLPPAALFSTIDAMPMRQQEMRRPR